MTNETLVLLHDTHILILVDEPVSRATMIDLFQSMGAKVHSAESQTAAIGMYWRLFRGGIRPRAVITSWRMVKKETADYEFLKLLGREDIDGTVLDLFNNITDLDISAFLAVYTNEPEEAVCKLKQYGIGASVFDQSRITIEDFVARIATHEGISKQRISEEIVKADLEQISRTAKTERITKTTKKNRSNYDLPALELIQKAG